jgi:hypothetical protein
MNVGWGAQLALRTYTKLPAERPCVSILALALTSVLWQAPQWRELPSPLGEFEPSQHRRRTSSAGGDSTRLSSQTNDQPSRLFQPPFGNITWQARLRIHLKMRRPGLASALTSSERYAARLQRAETARIECAVSSNHVVGRHAVAHVAERLNDKIAVKRTARASDDRGRC